MQMIDLKLIIVYVLFIFLSIKTTDLRRKVFRALKCIPAVIALYLLCVMVQYLMQYRIFAHVLGITSALI